MKKVLAVAALVMVAVLGVCLAARYEQLTVGELEIGTSISTIDGAAITLGINSTSYWAIVDTTQLVFIAGTVTNVIDPDITTQ